MVVGSYVPKSSEQLQCLRDADGIEVGCLFVCGVMWVGVYIK